MRLNRMTLKDGGGAMGQIEYRDPSVRANVIEIYIDGHFHRHLPACVFRALHKEGIESIPSEQWLIKVGQIEEKMAKSKAVYLLSRRSLLVCELKAKLCIKGYSAQSIQYALTFCSQAGALNDEELLALRVQKMVREGRSKGHIAMRLARMGVDGDMISRLLQTVQADPKQAILQLIAKRKERAFSSDSKEKNREIYYLLRRGFSLTDILSVLTSQNRSG